MAAWFPRRLSPRVVLVPLLSLAVLATISFVNWTERSSQWKSSTTSVPCQAADKLTSRQIDAAQTTGVDWWTPLYAQAHTRILHEPSAKIPSERCPSVRPSRAAIDTSETYSTLNFQVTFSDFYFFFSFPLHTRVPVCGSISLEMRIRKSGRKADTATTRTDPQLNRVVQ